MIAALSIHPGFAKNDGGGYDGYDAQYAYSIANAIPAGGERHRHRARAVSRPQRMSTAT